MVSGVSTEVSDAEHQEEEASLQKNPAFADPDGTEGRSWWRLAVVLLVTAGAIGFAVWKIHGNMAAAPDAAAGKHSSHDKTKATSVTLASVQKQSMPIYLTALGTVTPYYAVTVKTRVDGELMSVNVREGQSVHKGQLIAEIDPRPYEATLVQAQGQLAKDTATANYSKLEADRYMDLFKAGVISQDNQQLQTASAGQGSGALIADEGAVQAAKLNLTYTKITSPIDGVVGLRQVDPGNMVHAADTGGLLLITQLRPISVVFILPEDQIPVVRDMMKKNKGSSLKVEAYDRSESTHLSSGTLLTLDNQIDQNTGTDKAKAVFSNKDDALFPNQFVNVRLVLEQRPDALVIPSAALQTGSDGTFVYVARKGEPPAAGDGSGTHSGSHHHQGADAAATPAAPVAANTPHADKPAGSDAKADKGDAKADKEDSYYAEVRPVVVDVIEGNQVILKSGLAEGEQVVVDGQERLQSGSKLTPRTSGHSKSGKDSAKGKSGGDATPAAAPDATASGEHHHKDKAS